MEKSKKRIDEFKAVQLSTKSLKQVKGGTTNYIITEDFLDI